jgi:hypothetical protein
MQVIGSACFLSLSLCILQFKTISLPVAELEVKTTLENFNFYEIIKFAVCPIEERTLDIYVEN